MICIPAAVARCAPAGGSPGQRPVLTPGQRRRLDARTVSGAASSSGNASGKGKLTLQCPPALLELLKEHRKKQAAERLRAGSSWTDHDLVFATKRGGPIERTEDWRSWKAILAQAQVRDARVHDARHTAATLLIEQGVL